MIELLVLVLVPSPSRLRGHLFKRFSDSFHALRPMTSWQRDISKISNTVLLFFLFFKFHLIDSLCMYQKIINCIMFNKRCLISHEDITREREKQTNKKKNERKFASVPLYSHICVLTINSYHRCLWSSFEGCCCFCSSIFKVWDEGLSWSFKFIW